MAEPYQSELPVPRIAGRKVEVSSAAATSPATAEVVLVRQVGRLGLRDAVGTGTTRPMPLGELSNTRR